MVELAPLGDYVLTRARANAVRHLPPGTVLRRPSGAVEQRLWADLLALPSEADPWTWLCHERGEATAMLALRLVLDYARRQCKTLRRLPAGISIPAAYRRFWGDLLSVPAPNHPFTRGLWRPPPAAPAELRDLIAQMRPSMRPLAVTELPRLDARLSLLADLLSVPASVDPIAWLRERRALPAAFVSIAHVLNQCLPQRNALRPSGPVRHLVPGHVRICASRRMLIMVERLTFDDVGCLCLIHLTAYFSLRGVIRRDDLHAAIPMWRGFTEVSDDRGYQYLTEVVESQGGTNLWGWKQKLTLSVYPNVSAARELTFMARPVLMHVINHTLHEVIPVTVPGNLLWRVAVPR